MMGNTDVFHLNGLVESRCNNIDGDMPYHYLKQFVIVKCICTKFVPPLFGLVLCQIRVMSNCFFINPHMLPIIKLMTSI